VSRHGWIACALLASWGATARAQEPRGAVLGWPDVAAALARDPRLAAARSRVEAAEGAVGAARTPPNPELEATAGVGAARESTARRNEWALAVNVPLDWLARRGAEVDAARAGVEEAAAEADALRAEVAAELWRLHAEASFGQLEVEALEASEAEAEALARLVRRRVEAGEGRPVEIPRVEIEVERVRNELAGARARRDGALARLGTWLGARIARVRPAPAVSGPPASPGPIAAHPRVRIALARAAAARAEAAAARRSRVPAFSVGGYYASELDREAAGGRLTVTLPLWDWRSGPVQRAEAAAAAASGSAEAETRAVGAALDEAAAACGRARGAAERLATAILPRAESAARTLERTFQLGEAGLLDVVDARRVLIDVRRESLASARERDAACGALVLLSGGELP
jgi:cobalt-zinc-cadmium efflux system outer membrane protein